MKVKRTGRRVAALLLTCIMVLSLAACGGSGSSQQGGGGTSSGNTGAAMPQVTIRDGVARGQQVVVTDPEFSSDGLQLLGMEDGWFYGLYYNYSDDTNEESYELVRFQSDGSGLEHIQIQGKDAGTEIAAATFLDGCYYLGMVTYHNSEALDYALEHGYSQPQNFYGVGGLKIFRDLIYQMRGLMRADHRFYKAHGFYDFPQKRRGRILGMYAVGAMMNNKKLRRKLGGRMTEGMVLPYKKAIEQED